MLFFQYMSIELKCTADSAVHLSVRLGFPQVLICNLHAFPKTTNAGMYDDGISDCIPITSLAAAVRVMPFPKIFSSREDFDWFIFCSASCRSPERPLLHYSHAYSPENMDILLH